MAADKKKAPPGKDKTKTPAPPAGDKAPGKGETPETAPPADQAGAPKTDSSAQGTKKQGKCAGCGKFCYNKEDGSCMGRTLLSWLKVAIFYVILYLSLIAFFVMLLLVALSSFEPGMPRRQLEESLIGDPGLGYRPVNKIRDSALIWYNKDDPETYKDYVEQLINMTKADRNGTAYMHCHDINSSLKDCVKETGKMPNVYNDDAGGGKTDPKLKYEWGHCTEGEKFGFEAGKPCVLIRLNRIIGWEPGELPDNVPHFYQGISVPQQGDEGQYKGAVRLEKTHKMVCIYCEGENSFDNQVLGKIEYLPGGHRPGPCIPSFFFPFENQPNYLSPFIFVRFPDLPEATLIQVRCTAYNSKITPDAYVGVGMVRFELLVDTTTTIKK